MDLALLGGRGGVLGLAVTTHLTIYTRQTVDSLQLRDAKWTVGNDRGDQMTDQQLPHYQFHAQFNLSHELQVNCGPGTDRVRLVRFGTQCSRLDNHGHQEAVRE